MNGFLKELRFATRMLTKSPGVSGLAVAALALGIGVTATMFSIVYSALMRGLPFEDGDRIVHLEWSNPSRNVESQAIPIHDYLDWREQQSSFTHLAAFYEGTVNVRWADRPERFDGAFITANGFTALGVQPFLGRGFNEDEDEPGAPATIILAHHVWMDRFDGSPSAIGRVVGVNGEQAEIIGVMPEGFMFPNRQDVWVSLRLDPVALERGAGQWLDVYGKLRDGVTMDQAMVEFTGITNRLAAAYPETNEGFQMLVKPFHEEYIGDEAAGLLYTMLAAVSLVFLIACANVANLLLARAAVRTKEVGIRTAMGADRWRVVSQMMAEALALGLVGGLLGAGFAWVGIELFSRAIEGTNPPFFLVFKLDLPILGFILASSLVAAVVAGGIPALKATGMDVANVLKDESRGSSSLRIGRLSKVLVVGEIAMSMGLLVAAGLMTKSITTLKDYDFGFDTEEVFTARVGLFETEFPDTLTRRQFYEELATRVAAIPGVTSASLGTILPGVGSGWATFAVEGESYTEDRDYPGAYYGQAGPSYFRTFGASISSGRDFTPGDNAESLPVVIVNETFAAKHFPGESALNKRIRLGGADSQRPWRTVVGVVPDLWMQSVGNDVTAPREGFYVPVQQADTRFMSIVARGPADPMSLTAPVRDAVQAIHADTPIYFVNTLAARLEEGTWVYNVFGGLFMIFGAVALFLASVGLYGVMAFSVSRRTPEVGVRMALGAEGRQVLSLIMRQGLAQVGIGVVLGLGLAVLVAQGLQMVLFQVSARDPGVFVLVAVVLLGTGLTASLIPARRATRVDPLVALRSD